MQDKFFIPISFPESSLQAIPIKFDYNQQQIIVADTKIQIKKDELVIVQQSKLQKLMNVSLDQNTADIVPSILSDDNIYQQYTQISEWRYDDSVQIPGPQILKNVVVQTPYFELKYKRADRILHFQDEKLDLHEPIYFVMVLQQEQDLIGIALTAVRFPGGYYGNTSSMANGHVHLLTFKENQIEIASAEQQKIESFSVEAMPLNESCNIIKKSDTAVNLKEQIITKDSVFDPSMNQKFFEQAQNLLKEELQEEPQKQIKNNSQVLSKNDGLISKQKNLNTTGKTEQLFQLFISEANKSNPNAQVMEQIRLLLQFYQ